MVREDDDLEDVRVDRFAETKEKLTLLPFVPDTIWAGGRNAQPLAVVARLRRDVERDPPVGTVERDRAHFLQVAEARAGAYGERRGRVGVVELVAQVEAEFLSSVTLR